MKKFLIAFLLCLMCGEAWGANLSNSNMINSLYYCGDSTYLYGRSNTTATLMVKRDASGTVINGKDFTGYSATYNKINCVFATSTDNLIFAVVTDTSNKSYLFKSVDGGANFGSNDPSYNDGNYVLQLGLDGANQTTNVMVLGPSSFCEATIGGSKVFLLGEYNINASRTDGGENDKVRLLKSTDSGSTWTQVICWNDDGSNHNIRHIHTVQQDPYTGDIYITTGDANSNAMILRWNGTSDISSFSNHSPSWYLTASGNVSYATNGLSAGIAAGAQRYRAGNILFGSTYVYYGADTYADDAERGIWVAPKDLSSVSRADSSVISYDAHSIFGGVKTTEGYYILCHYIETGATDFRAHILISTDGETWTDTGTIGMKNAEIGPVGIFEWKSKIYLPYGSLSGGFAGDNGGTLVLQTDTSYLESPTRILSPVYYVNKTGLDTNDGRSFSSPWLTVRRGISSTGGAAEICRGGLVKIGAGDYDEGSSGILGDYDAYSPTTGNTVFQGAGKSDTIIHTSSNTFYQCNAEETNTDFRDLAFYTTGTTAIINLQSGATVNFYGVRLGNPSYSCDGIRLYGGTANLYAGCELVGYPSPAGSIYGIDYKAGSSNATCEYVLMTGYTDHVWLDYAGSTYTEYNCTHYNYKSYGLAFDSPSDQVPTVKNSIFYSEISGAKSLIDGAGLSEADENIDYNCYYNSLKDIANSGGAHSLLSTNPRFVNPTGGNFHVKFGSPCINAGADLSLTSDIEGTTLPWRTGMAPTIGAYEQPKINLMLNLLGIGG